LNQCLKIKSSGKKVIDFNILCYVQEKNLFGFFLFKNIFFKLFIGIFYLKMYKFFICQLKCISYENLIRINIC
jgi:hypothetical protein